MNENEVFSNSSIENTCRVCLKSTSDLYTMCEDLVALYSSCVDVVVYEEYMKTCTICRFMLRKLRKFKQQCQLANNLLNNVYMDTKAKTFAVNLSQTNINISSYIAHPLDKKRFHVKYTYEMLNDNCKSTNNIRICDISKNDDENDFKNETNNFDSGDDHFDSHDDRFDSQDNDEIPLVLLKNEKKKRKRLKNKLLPTNEINIKSKENGHRAPKTKKKELKEGFTSRMVQETEEYTVIKLSKEQVLEEMEERAKTDTYIRSPFKCKKCVKGFNFDDVLQTHMEKHSMKNGSFQCDMCNQYCPSAVSLRGHVKSHTTRYKCKLCGHIRLSRQHLLEHYAISHTSAATTYNCGFCKFTTNKRTIMQRHVRRHASSESHACHKCGKLFKTIESLRLHTVRHDKSSRFKCNSCEATFTYISLLRRHEICVHERREYYCVECDIQFISSESLRLHFKKAKKHRDSSANKHACPHCPQRFFTRASLSVHLTSTHDVAKTHACVACARLYSSRDALRAHTWRTHASKKCTHCGGYTRKNASKSCVCSCQSAHENEQKKDDVQYQNKIEE